MSEKVTELVVWLSLGFIFFLVAANIACWVLVIILAPLGAGINIGGE